MSEATTGVKQEVNIWKFVCVLCLDSFPTEYTTKDGTKPTTKYFMNNWNQQCVRICFNCFHYG